VGARQPQFARRLALSRPGCGILHRRKATCRTSNLETAFEEIRPDKSAWVPRCASLPPLGCNTDDVNSKEREVSILNKGSSGSEDCEMGG
jgi:hypothetical protein